MGYADLLARLDAVRTLGVELGLDRVRLALARLGDPQRRFAAVLIRSCLALQPQCMTLWREPSGANRPRW